MTVAVIVVAAGRGSRLGGETPKQYLSLNGKCALRRSVDAFLSVDRVDLVRVLIHADDRLLYTDAVAGIEDPRLLDCATGGVSRAATVRLGLLSLADLNVDFVVVHDAARPFVSPKSIEELLNALTDSEGACLAIPVVDSLWKVEDEHAVSSHPRDRLWRAQTPQGFHFGPFLSAHRAHDGSATDDVAVAREAGLSVRFLIGKESNYKITTALDLARAIIDAERADNEGASQPARGG